MDESKIEELECRVSTLEVALKQLENQVNRRSQKRKRYRKM